MELTDEQKALAREFDAYFSCTGGNDPVELIERKGVTYHNNYIVAELQGATTAQLMMLSRLRQEGILGTPAHVPAPKRRKVK